MPVEDPRNVEEAAEWLRKHFRPEAARELSAVFQVELTGDAGGALQVQVDRGAAQVVVGVPVPAHLRIRLEAGDFYAILAGRENAELLLMADRIAFEGETSLAAKFRTLFRRNA